MCSDEELVVRREFLSDVATRLGVEYSQVVDAVREVVLGERVSLSVAREVVFKSGREQVVALAGQFRSRVGG